MGQPVPADDLPGAGGTVPASDLPTPPAPHKEIPVTGTQPTLNDVGNASAFTELPRTVLQNMGANIASGYAGLAGAILPGEPGQGARWQAATQQALSHEPQDASTQGGLKLLEIPSMPVHWAAEKVGEQGEKVGPGLATVGKTSVEALPLLLGARSMTTPKKPLTAAQQRVADARDAGFKLTPEEMGAGPVPRTAASIAGEPRLARGISNKNTAVAVAKAKAELGLRPDAPLDLDALTQIRKAEGLKYEPVRNVGQVPMDATYLAEIDKLASKYRSAASEFPGAQKLAQLQLQEIDDTIRMLRKEDPAVAAAQAHGIKLPQGAQGTQAFNASGAVDMIGALREGADAAFRSGKNALAKVMRGGAEALEAQIDRHLTATAPGSTVLKDFRDARTQIAKTYAVEKALIGDDTINMQALGAQVSKRKPLTGGLQESGEAARNFPRSTQKPSNIGTGATLADVLAAGVNAIRSQGGSVLLDAATVGARPAVRSLLASRPAQWAMDPRTNFTNPALEAAAVSGALPTPQEEKR